MQGISTTEPDAGASVDEAVRHYLEGRVAPAVRILERSTLGPAVDPHASRALTGILGTLDSMARLDPQFGRARRELRRRLLVLADLAERRAGSPLDALESGGE